jgi:hypothetical protein
MWQIAAENVVPVAQPVRSEGTGGHQQGLVLQGHLEALQCLGSR